MVPELLFITGTDTDVGKTVVTACIASVLRDAGVRVAAVKPVETGVDYDAPCDSDILLTASTDLSAKDSCLYRLKNPLAPAVAADLEGVDVDVSRILSHIRYLQRTHQSVLVEGAGGLMVPLRWNYSFLDLACDLHAAVIIVGRAGLGTINHCILTVHALRMRGMEPFGLVLNGRSSDPSLAERTNASAVKRLIGCDRLVELPRVEAHSVDDVIGELKPHVTRTIGGWFGELDLVG